ncbi:MAG: zinc-ribbon domain-containing protein [Desulfuromonadales bacterium]|nr:zinc-ribbon domain-containing protein [Desulfuromonadales bacterium]
MIISCQHCGKRARIDAGKYAGKRVKMRCSQCSEIFVVEVPLRAAAPAAAALQVLIAHSDPVLCDTVGTILSSHDFSWKACHDGEAALELLDRDAPQVVIVDVALPGLFAFEVVDKIRNRPGLASVKIMLLSSVYNKMAYKRRPTTLYGADDYIEKHHIPIDLITKIHKLLASSQPALNRAATAPEGMPTLREIDEVQGRLQRAEESEGIIAPSAHAELEKARRLARIIASDIALYDEARITEGIRSGTFFELFAAEIAEGRQHFLGRIPESLPHRSAILDDAFNELIEHFRRENHL